MQFLRHDPVNPRMVVYQWNKSMINNASFIGKYSKQAHHTLLQQS